MGQMQASIENTYLSRIFIRNCLVYGDVLPCPASLSLCSKFHIPYFAMKTWTEPGPLSDGSRFGNRAFVRRRQFALSRQATQTVFFVPHSKANTMSVRLASCRMAAAMLFAVASAIHAQTFTSIPAIPFDTAGPLIQAHAEPLKPFNVAGERGVVLGQQDGTFEAWVLPVKLLSHLTIEAEVEGNKTKNWRCRCPQPGLQKLLSSAGGIR